MVCASRAQGGIDATRAPGQLERTELLSTKQ
jgi:hypothetical protein